MMKNRTKIVREMYTKYPYPYPDNIIGELDDMAVYMKYFEKENNVSFKNSKILDAGCGTGNRTIEMAKAYPNASFIGIDMTTNSLNIARRQAKELGITNVEFYEKNILEPINLGKFDLIISTGVVHHLENPKLGLNNLMNELKDNGMILLWLYGYLGEFDRMMNRELVKTLMKDTADFEDGMNIIKELKLSINSDRYGNSYASSKITENVQESIDADAFLHEIVNFYRIDDIINLFKNTCSKYFFLDGITLSSQNTLRAIITDKKYYDEIMKYTEISDFLPDRLIKRYMNLSKEERYKILELLYKPTGYTLLAWKNKPNLGERINEGIIKI